MKMKKIRAVTALLVVLCLLTNTLFVFAENTTDEEDAAGVTVNVEQSAEETKEANTQESPKESKERAVNNETKSVLSYKPMSTTRTITYKSNGGVYSADIVNVLSIGGRIAGKGVDDTAIKTLEGIDVAGTDYRPSGMFTRFYAWNTKVDGSGDWYRGGQVISEETPDDLVLYAQWFNALSFGTGFDASKVKPAIEINGSSNYLTKESAFIADKASDFELSGKLSFDGVKNFMALMWGRIDEVKVENAKGKMVSRLDGRLLFENKMKLTFESSFLIPDMPYTKIGDGKYEIEIDSSDITYLYKNTNGEWEVMLPVKFISKAEIYNMSFNDFIKPSSIKFSGSSITEESFNAIAKSDNPYIFANGDVDLKMNMYSVNLPLNNSGEEQWIKFVAPEEEETVYKLIKDFGTFKGKGTLSAKVDAPVDMFSKLYIEGVEVDASNYTVTDGSIIVTLSEDYLKTLENKKYSASIELTNNQKIAASLAVDVAQGDNPPPEIKDPKTGVEDYSAIWVLMILMSGLGIFILRKKLQKN